ncbi:hypothetical protein [Kutzneria albida]|uniref:hypothetical protein n=1 Tax=Kutzneria albida TaxID=43357 RepID=UPI00046D4828|nr:hypothetical protein [Kutzneria albida]
MPVRREQVVAASLVGSVVVVLGFASGLGVHNAADGGGTSAQAGGLSTPSSASPPMTSEPAQPGGTQSSDSQYPGDARGQASTGQPIMTELPLPPTGPVATWPAQPPTTTPTPSVTPQPETPCHPGLLGPLLAPVVQPGLPLVGGLVVGVTTALPLNGLLSPLVGACPTTSTTVPTTTPTPGP